MTLTWLQWIVIGFVVIALIAVAFLAFFAHYMSDKR